MAPGRGMRTLFGGFHVPDGRLLYPARFDAIRTHSNPSIGPIFELDLHPLKVGQPPASRLVVGVAHVVPRRGALATHIAHSGHRSISSIPFPGA